MIEQIQSQGGAEASPGSEMYWDGTTWRTDLVRQPGVTDAAVPAHATVPAPSKRPWYTRKAVIIPAAVVIGLIVIGGIGSITGAMLGGLILGLLESFGTHIPFIGSEWKDVFTFSILILVLVFKPTGLLGKSEVERM